jgi:hypothetical protein
VFNTSPFSKEERERLISAILALLDEAAQL